MDREWLASQLEAGRSLESIAREHGCAPSTVASWANKHGLSSTHAARHAARGGVDRERLTALVDSGLSLRAIAAELELSYSTVRHWVRRYGLATPRARRLGASAPARRAAAEEAMLDCPHHGLVLHVRRGKDGFRCRVCRSEAASRRRRAVKEVLVGEAGGACRRCGYAGPAGAMHFHHVDPTIKSFAVSGAGVARSLARSRAEISKCVLLCANCHAEVEAGVATIAPEGPADIFSEGSSPNTPVGGNSIGRMLGC
jgi:transposase-like protein